MKKQTKTILWVVGILIVLLIVARFVLQFIFEWDMPFMYSHMFTPLMFPLGMLAMVVFWGAVIYLVYRLLIQDRNTKTEDDLTVLKGRLSRGEITIEEYETIKKTLSEDK